MKSSTVFFSNTEKTNKEVTTLSDAQNSDNTDQDPASKKTQALLEDAARRGKISEVETIILKSRAIPLGNLDISRTLICAARGKVFNDDKSCMHFLSGIRTNQVQSFYIGLFNQYGGFLAGCLGITFTDFGPRLAMVYHYMAVNGPHFDSAYEQMLREFSKNDSSPDKSKPAPGKK